MNDYPLKEMSDTHSSPLLGEPLSSRYKLYESEFTSTSCPSSPQDTHPALPLLEMPEEKVRNVPRMPPRLGDGRKDGERCCFPSFPMHVLHNAVEGPLPREILPSVNTWLYP